MAKFAELKDVVLDDMVILHENDSHFNLVVSKNSNLATLGSLSYRFNIGPIVKNGIEDEAKEEKKGDKEEEKSTKDGKLRKEIKRLKDANKLFETNYLQAEKVVRMKTEENTRLKAENKDLKEILKLDEDLKEAGDTSDNEEETLLELKSKGFKRKNPQVEASPKKDSSKVNELEFNCNDCFFQGTSQSELNNHINMKHTRKDMITEGEFKCNNCDEQFKTRERLMHHRKLKHLNIVALCRNNLLGRCPFTPSLCWWNHAEKREVSGNIECYICSKRFENKTLLMIHRKTNHTNIVKVCNQYLNGQCRFRDESCWFSHEPINVHKSNNYDDIRKENGNINQEQVFQRVSEDLEPPIINQERRNMRSQSQ